MLKKIENIRRGIINLYNDIPPLFIAVISLRLDILPIEKSVESRKKAKPIRFIYDAEMGGDLLNYLLNKMELTLNESNIGGARYHNFKDCMTFPALGKSNLSYTPIEELKSQPFDKANSIFSA